MQWAALGVLGLAVLGVVAILGVRHFAMLMLCVVALRPMVGSEGVEAGLGGLDPGDLLGLVFIAAASTWLLAHWRSLRPRTTSPVALTSAALVLLAALSAATSCCRMATIGGTLKLGSFVLILLVLERLAAEDPRYAEKAVGVALVASVPSVLLAITQHFSGADTSDLFDVSRVTGLFSHPNLLATHLTLLLLLVISVFPYLVRRLQVAAGMYVVAAGSALFFTLSRTAWLAFVAGLLLVGLLQHRAVLIGVILLLPVLTLAVPGIQSRFSDVSLESLQVGEVVDPEEEFTQSNTLEWRIAYWGKVLPLAQGNELRGVGFETVAERRPEAFPPHNEFVRAFVEMGIFGLLAFGAVLVACARTAILGLRSAQPGLQRGFAIAFCACAVALAIRLPVENLLTDVPNLWLFAVIAAPVLGRLSSAADDPAS